MQVSTKVFNDQALGGFNRLNESIQDTQTRIATGKNVLRASDDPILAANISVAKEQSAKLDHYTTNIERGTLRLTMAETAMDHAVNSLTRIYELSVQANNDTYGPSERNAIKQEILQIKEQLLELANSKDAGGQALFGGFSTLDEAFSKDADGTITYKGDRGIPMVSIADNMRLQTAIDGATVFQRVPSSTGFTTVFAVIEDVESIIDGGMQTRLPLDDLQSAIAHVGDQRTVIGAQINKANSQSQVLEDRKLMFSENLSKMEDADLAAMVTELQALILSRDAAQQAFAKVGQQSLFDFIR
jgi:flagellar hook-associated protein 3